MKVKFKKKYKDARGRTFNKGAEEGLDRATALPLINSGYCVPVVEFEDTGLLNSKGEQILKKK